MEDSVPGFFPVGAVPIGGAYALLRGEEEALEGGVGIAVFEADGAGEAALSLVGGEEVGEKGLVEMGSIEAGEDLGARSKELRKSA